MSKNTIAQQIAALTEQVNTVAAATKENAATLNRVLVLMGEQAAPESKGSGSKGSKGSGSSKGKGSKGSKKAKAQGPSFAELRSLLREHKKAGLIPAGVSVREAQAQGLMDEQGRVTGSPVEAEPAKARKTRKVAAKVEADQPAKTPASEAPRRADGTITPKSEWALRESLAESGRFDRHEIDAIVASFNA